MTERYQTAHQPDGKQLTLGELNKLGLPDDLPLALPADYGLEQFATKAVVGTATNDSRKDSIPALLLS